MSSDLPEMPEDDDDLLAAEYVLRLLSADLEGVAARRVDEDPEFAARVHHWESRLADLADELDEVRPSPRVRRALLASVGGAPESRARRWWLGAGLGVATLAALAYVAPLPFLTRGPDLGAELASADGALRYEAQVTGDELVLARLEGGPREGRALELWLIAQDDPAPVSLGVLPDADVAEVALTPALAARMAGGTLAVSDEPPGGSPTGAPTGEVLAAAPLVEL
ncbi:MULTISPECIES: anti-sigma factor domain-containing protein [unclassified Mameliella]|uniref:anti-sigma factor n=1 Tax=unclassified Mameliella TaxID=2630630 RepID=UPI00273D43EF|nr:MULTISPECIES: anti-sigma factor [unclassified Mameliella]